MSLFACLVGGTVPGMRLEVHDVLFAEGACIEDCVPSLRAQWRGEPASLHLDGWGRLDAADGHRIVRRDAPPGGDRLFFVHLGGYDPARFTERHDNLFVVAPDAKAAKARALAQARYEKLPHRDALLACDVVEDVTRAAGAGFLVPEPEAGARFEFTVDYVPLGAG